VERKRRQGWSNELSRVWSKCNTKRFWLWGFEGPEKIWVESGKRNCQKMKSETANETK
jgi:hypothetical protein